MFSAASVFFAEVVVAGIGRGRFCQNKVKRVHYNLGGKLSTDKERRSILDTFRKSHQWNSKTGRKSCTN